MKEEVKSGKYVSWNGKGGKYVKWNGQSKSEKWKVESGV
jgi:hypothetical protein